MQTTQLSFHINNKKKRNKVHCILGHPMISIKRHIKTLSFRDIFDIAKCDIENAFFVYCDSDIILWAKLKEHRWYFRGRPNCAICLRKLYEYISLHFHMILNILIRGMIWELSFWRIDLLTMHIYTVIPHNNKNETGLKSILA